MLFPAAKKIKHKTWAYDDTRLEPRAYKGYDKGQIEIKKDKTDTVKG